jgi:hypothetical protein
MKGAGEWMARSPDCVLMTEFWPYGLRASGNSAEEYLAELTRCGFRLFELKKNQCESFDPAELIQRLSGRQYANLVGFKGAFAP